MASVTQKIPSYVLGISTQPDERKAPGQVTDLVNGIPDVVNQLQKRPGTHLITTLSPSTASHTKWFNIYTNDSEQYIGQVGADGAVLIWRCSDGASIPVDYADVAGTNKATYLDNQALSDEKSSDIQVNTINETTFFVNRRKTVAMKTGANDKSPTQLNEAFIELDTISYGKQYALDIYDPTDNTEYSYPRATAIVVDEIVSLDGTSSDGNNLGNGDCEGMGRETVTVNTGTAIHSTSPPNTSSGGKSNLRYEMDSRCTPQPTDDSDNDNYHDAYNPYAKLQFGGEGWTTNDTHQYTSQKGLTTTVTIKKHVTITSRANIAMVRPDATSSDNAEHVSAAGILGGIKTALDAISGTNITATIVGNGIHLYSKDAFGVTTPERTLMNIITSEANDISTLPRVARHGYVVRVVNSGEDVDDYYLRFQVEGITADITQTATYARSGTTVTISKTAHGLSNGDQIFVDFTSGAAVDGLYTISNVSSNAFDIAGQSGIGSGTISAGETVTFTPARFGEGIWEEVAAPGLDITLDNTTMPLKLTRVLPGTFSINGGSATTYSNGAFKFGYPDWGVRDVGDDITNPTPSFVGYPIQKMIFFRNRIALLSAENVILSRVNDFYNFWVKTAMAISNADPIDLQSSSTFPTKLYDAVEANAGLVLFSASEQFLLSSGAEALLTPETAKISYLASYGFDSDTNAIELGTSVGWLNSTAKDTRFFEMAGVGRDSEPEIVEQSKIVGKLIPQNTSQVTNSPENELVLFAIDSTLHTASNEVWGHKYYTVGGRREQSAWFRWTFPNNVVFHAIMDDIYYLVLNTGSTYTFERLDLKLKDSTLLIGSNPNEYRVHLDTKKTFASGDLTYNGQTDVTTFTLGAGYYSSRTLTAYCTTDSDAAGKSYDIPAAKITGTAPNQTVTLPGNWKTSTEAGSSTTSVNTDVVIGYEYEFEVELPKIFMARQEGEAIRTETRGSLVIHRMNFDFGEVGVLDVTLKRKGRSDYTYTVESKEWDNITASTAAIAETYLHTIPVYDRNTNLTVQIKSNHPSPATLYSMNWEGDYSARYYQRV